MIMRINSVSDACAVIDGNQIIVSSCAPSASSGHKVLTIDDFGNTQYYFVNNEKVWYVSCPIELDNLHGIAVEITRPYWASTIIEATNIFINS